jgi:hypothetical protein
MLQRTGRGQQPCHQPQRNHAVFKTTLRSCFRPAASGFAPPTRAVPLLMTASFGSSLRKPLSRAVCPPPSTIRAASRPQYPYITTSASRFRLPHPSAGSPHQPRLGTRKRPHLHLQLQAFSGSHPGGYPESSIRHAPATVPSQQAMTGDSIQTVSSACKPPLPDGVGFHLEGVESALGYCFKDKALLMRALTKPPSRGRSQVSMLV